jgi:hypothetical protein
MGIYDTLKADLDGNTIEFQVKTWDSELRTWHPGDKLPDAGAGKNYAIVSEDGEFYANVHNGIFQGFSHKPNHKTIISKWGGAPDELSPVAEALRMLGRQASGWKTLQTA